LRLSGVNGDVEIVTDADFLVEGTRRVGSFSLEDAEASLSRLSVVVVDTGTEIQIETRQPDGDFRDYEVDYRLTVPDGVELILTTVNGTVTAEPRSGSAVISVVNGAVVAETALPDNCVLGVSMVNGIIDVSLPAATSASFAASVVNGSIAVHDLALQVSLSTPTRLEGTLGAGEATIGLSTVNGTIVVRGV
jgi:DUF4097 and DUF4098 domain-containing protein YvlB